MDNENEKINEVEAKNNMSDEIKNDDIQESDAEKTNIEKSDKAEIQIDEECEKKQPQVSKDTKKIGFNDSFMSSLVDVIITGAISFIGYLILNFVILKLVGYRFAKEYTGTGVFIIFAIVALLYPSIMRAKSGRTVGEKYSKIIIKKEEK